MEVFGKTKIIDIYNSLLTKYYHTYCSSIILLTKIIVKLFLHHKTRLIIQITREYLPQAL